MKIVINALSARQGGGQTYVKNLLANLPADADLEILVFAPASLKLPTDPRIRRGVTSWPTENPLLRTVWEKLALPGILRAEKADILFCPGGVVATRAPRGCKVVTMFRNMIPFDKDALSRMAFGLQKLRSLILRRVMLRSMAEADLTIFISDYARDVIENLVRVPHAVTIPHGINEAFRTHGKTLERPAWLPEGEYMLYVSKFDVYKHHREVALAYAGLPDALRARYKLILVGETDEVLASEVMQLVKDRQLERDVIVAGPRAYDDLPPAYRNATVNLFASSCENCPNILLEALGAGRPVLSSNIPPMPEFGAEAAGYFLPTNPESIREAMEKALGDEDYRGNLAEASARRSDDFSWELTSRRTWKSIGELV